MSKQVLYRKLPFHDALRLRRYRLDQYSERFEKVKFQSTRRLTHRMSENVPSKTSFHAFGRQQIFKREPIMTGIPIMHKSVEDVKNSENDTNIFYEGHDTQKIINENNNQEMMMPESLQLNNYGSGYLQQSNIFSINKVKAGEKQEYLPDEIALEELYPIKDASHKPMGNILGNGIGSMSSDNLTICLKTFGCKNRRFYNIYVVYKRHHRIKNHNIYELLENLGSYDPIPNRWGQKVCGLNVSRIKYWIACGVDIGRGF